MVMMAPCMGVPTLPRRPPPGMQGSMGGRQCKPMKQALPLHPAAPHRLHPTSFPMSARAPAPACPTTWAWATVALSPAASPRASAPGAHLTTQEPPAPQPHPARIAPLTRGLVHLVMGRVWGWHRGNPAWGSGPRALGQLGWLISRLRLPERRIPKLGRLRERPISRRRV